MSASLEQARTAIAAYGDTDNDEAWSEIELLREGLRRITVEDATVLLDDLRARDHLGGECHQFADEIITAILPESIRERYLRMQEGGAWWYAGCAATKRKRSCIWDDGRVLRCVRWYFLIPDGGAHKRIGSLSEWECTLEGSRIDRSEAERLIKDFCARGMPDGIKRDDGLTDAEGEVHDALCAAANAYGQLPKQHPSEPDDFCDAIHRCQDLLAVRIARRHYPKGWPVKA